MSRALAVHASQGRRKSGATKLSLLLVTRRRGPRANHMARVCRYMKFSASGITSGSSRGRISSCMLPWLSRAGPCFVAAAQFILDLVIECMYSSIYGRAQFCARYLEARPQYLLSHAAL